VNLCAWFSIQTWVFLELQIGASEATQSDFGISLFITEKIPLLIQDFFYLVTRNLACKCRFKHTINRVLILYTTFLDTPP
jgi:hypothetical protein